MSILLLGVASACHSDVRRMPLSIQLSRRRNKPPVFAFAFAREAPPARLGPPSTLDSRHRPQASESASLIFLGPRRRPTAASPSM